MVVGGGVDAGDEEGARAGVLAAGLRMGRELVGRCGSDDGRACGVVCAVVSG